MRERGGTNTRLWSILLCITHNTQKDPKTERNKRNETKRMRVHAGEWFVFMGEGRPWEGLVSYDNTRVGYPGEVRKKWVLGVWKSWNGHPEIGFPS